MAHRVDFRSAGNVFPSYEEVVLCEKVELEPNITDGPYESMENYLKTHFWLFREDFVLSVRKGVQEYLQFAEGKDAKFDSSYVKIHKKVKFVKQEDGSGKQSKGIVELLNPDGNSTRSMKFKMGSLLCFTCNNFKTLLFATVSFKDEKLVPKLQIPVEFCQDYEEDIFKSDYMMIECKNFFEFYHSVLTALQQIDSKHFPFQKYLIKLTQEDSLPEYLRSSTTPALISVKGVGCHFKCELTNFDAWPSETQLGLNNSQLKALQAALTRELAIIQGPPGTGKTFLLLKIVEILIQNKRNSNRKKPIMIICPKNYALDEILVKILKITKKLVRFGDQSKHPELEAYNFKNLGVSRYQRLQRLPQQDVIALTTTRAAKMRSELNELGCEIVIVEEAAAAFEAHLIACIPDKCQHLIMIGDHKQLRPLVKNEKDLETLKLDISLFERMVLNREGSCCTLDVQYRMVPEITKLISPSIYKNLTDHESVCQRQAFGFLTKRVSFITHTFPEFPAFEKNENRGRKNDHEAEFVIELCKYLLLQKGVTSADVTILTPYKDQVSAIEQLISNGKSGSGKTISEVKIATLDDFQGGESNIIILSLVRSNDRKRKIDFLDHPNRVSVALSKAKNGLIMIGNIRTLSTKSGLWKSIKHSLEEQSALGSSLVLSCAEHPKSSFEVQKPYDFKRLCPNGGCNQICMKPADCGHRCQAHCHPGSDHSEYLCHEPCLRSCNADLHPCPLECHVKCGSNCQVKVEEVLSCGRHKAILTCSQRDRGKGKIKCSEMIQKVFPGCNHTALVPCGQQDDCPMPCGQQQACGHLCKRKCHFNKLDESHQDVICNEMVEVERSCGHIVGKICHEDAEQIKCNAVCNKKRECGHTCRKKCFKDCEPCRKCTILRCFCICA